MFKSLNPARPGSLQEYIAVMKPFSARFVMIAGLVVAAQSFAFAQDKIAVIDMQSAIVSTQEGQAAANQLQTDFVGPRTQTLEGMQTELQTLSDRLTRGSNTMSEQAKADLQREIDQKTKTFNRAVEDYQVDSEEQQRILLEDLSTKMRTVIANYLPANGYAVLLDARNPNSGLVWASEAVDITAAIIAAYDAAHPVAGAATAAPPAATPGATAATPGATAGGQQ